MSAYITLVVLGWLLIELDYHLANKVNNMNRVVQRHINGYTRFRTVSTGHALIEHYLIPLALGSFVCYALYNALKWAM